MLEMELIEEIKKILKGVDRDEEKLEKIKGKCNNTRISRQ